LDLVKKYEAEKADLKKRYESGTVIAAGYGTGGAAALAVHREGWINWDADDGVKIYKTLIQRRF
jgi:hypothetical protein